MDIESTRDFASKTQAKIEISDIESAIKKSIGEKVNPDSVQISKGGDPSGTHIGKRYILTEFIEAQLISDVWRDLSQTQKNHTRKIILQLVESVKGINAPYFGDINKNGNRGYSG